MQKPISNFYTIVWIEVPDEPARATGNGTNGLGVAALARWRGARARASRFLNGPRWTAAVTMLGLFFARS